ncbi:1,4-alpha-glucan-branching enzyme 1 [Magnetospirillum sp. LM-5]|nr:1,4-alpha-glucan-branching enzyme 1 [Magnetospirillum sp. LM-5]
MRVLSFALVMGTLAASQALAQQAPADQQGVPEALRRFQAYATSDAYKKTVSQIATIGDSISAPECKEHKPMERAAVTIFKPALFGEGLHPVDGLWMDRIKMSRCGTPVMQNILVRAQANGQPPQMQLKMPGATSANPPMQDAVMTDVLASLAKGKCSDQTKIIPVDSKLDKEIKPRKIDAKGMLTEGAWKETWVFNACGKKTNIGVEFAADGKGSLTHKVK